MPHPLSRRTFLMAGLLLPSLGTIPSNAADRLQNAQTVARLQKIERAFGGQLGVYVIDTGSGATLGYHADERFPVCSTFKVVVAAACLAKSVQVPGLMQRRITYQKGNLANYSPITEKHLTDGLTVAELCAAAIQYSDNTAANLMMRLLGGPAAVNAFARSVGDKTFRLDRWETALNTAISGDLRDTSTPKAMGTTLQRLALGKALRPQDRQQLQEWMLGNTTGAARIQAGLPAGWKIGDKTGTGDYGTAHDIAVVWPPHRSPIIIAIYTRQNQQEAKAHSEVLASATRVIVDWLKISK